MIHGDSTGSFELASDAVDIIQTTFQTDEPLNSPPQQDQVITHAEPILFASPDIDDADIEAVSEVLRSGWITTGEQCQLLEDDLSRYLDIDHVVAMSSCTAALETAVAYLKLNVGARIGVPTWTFASSALVGVHRGLVPVLLDVDPETLNLSAEALSRAISSGIEAVVGVHFAGTPLAPEIHELAHEAGIPLIEDAAHALGTRDHRGLVAGQGTAGASFSFYATKNLTSGEGGALATNDPELASFARSFRLHGLSHDAWSRYRPDSTGSYDLDVAGIKGNMPDVLAALARSQFTRFAAMQRHRRTLVGQYRTNLAGMGGVEFIPANPDDNSADHLMVVLLPPNTNRDFVVNAFQSANIATSVHFQPLHTFGWFQENSESDPGGFPVADSMAPRALSLPLHTRLTLTDVDRICEVLLDALATAPSN